MSLVAFAIRMCLQKALIDKTIAEDRVFDSMVTPLDVKSDEMRLPIITVCTDDDQATTRNFELNTPDTRELDVIVELALASAVTIDGEVQVTIPQTDAGLEASLNIMHRQVYRAVMDDADPWAALLREFLCSVGKVLVRRGAGADKGVRFAARQIIFNANPLFEPWFGAAPEADGVWDRLLTLMAADPELDDLARALRASLIGEPLPDWRVLQTSLGMSRLAISAIGLGPLDATQTGAEATAGQGGLDDADSDGSATLLDDAAASFEIPLS
jgi:hypothetical protein